MSYPPLSALPAAVLVAVLAAVPVSVLVSAVGLAPVPAASAHADDDEAREEGRCGTRIRWRMEAKPDDGRVELKVEMHTVRTGKRWSWVLAHNGSLSDRGFARTSGSSGSFEIESTAVDVTGPDTFRFRATRKAIVCVARVTL